jgi:hypothetical protein
LNASTFKIFVTRINALQIKWQDLFSVFYLVESIKQSLYNHNFSAANINTVENKGAVPPGIYKLLLNRSFFCQQFTPSIVSTATRLFF